MMRGDKTPEREGSVGEFARAFPAIASRLAQPLPIPFVERVVEGLGVLAGRVERVLDAAAPRAAVHTADVLFPELLRPFPASTVLEIAPAASQARQSLGAGQEFDSVSLDGTRCRFRAHAPLRIDPWRVEDVRVVNSRARGQWLEVVLRPTFAARTGDPTEPLLPLRLFVGGEPRAAFALLASLHERLAGIEVETGGRVTELPPSALRPWGFHSEEALLPPEPLEHPGFRLLREFLVMPAKFAFVEVTGDAPVAASSDRAVLRFRFDPPLPPSAQITRETLRTNCIPVTNVFASTTEPLRMTLERPSHVLRPAGLSPTHGDVYAVRRVTGRLADRQTTEIVEAAAFGRGASGAAAAMGYALRRAPGAKGKGSDLRLALEYANDAGEAPDVHVLTVDAWATNRDLPRTLGVGDVRIPTTLSPPRCTFQNVLAITPYAPSPDGVDLRWRTLALLALTARPLARADSLRALLHALNLRRSADASAARAHAQRLDAIREVQTSPATCSLSHGVARGTDVSLELMERAFDGEGEAYVFARVVSHLFAHEASLNAFTRTRVRHIDTGREYTFAPMNGDAQVG